MHSKITKVFSSKWITTIPLLLICLNVSLLLYTSNLPIRSLALSTQGSSSENVSSEISDSINLTLLHINDLHGWLNPRDGIGGVASYMGYFRQEGFDPNTENSSYLLFSGGDQNTGPATATLSKGEAVIDVMNTMGFDAACIGNHEFDFGVEWMNKRKEQANFPILSSNIFDVGTTDLANFTVPWVIQNHSGISVGIIGLTTTSTYTTAHPKVTSHFDFGDYESAIRQYVPEVQAAGANFIIVLAHASPGTLTQLAYDVSDLGVAIFLGGHAGSPIIGYEGGAIVAMAAHKSQQYVKIELSINRTTGEVISSIGELIDNIDGGVIPDSEIQAVVDQWDTQINAAEVLTYTSEDVFDDSGTTGIGALVTDAFIYHFGYEYNFGITNRGGGFRDYFRAGDISIADVVSVVPFENNLMAFSMTGEEIKNFIYFEGLALSGIRNIDGTYQIQKNGIYSYLNPTETYTGLITDYTWYVQYQDSIEAFDTGVHYRDTIIAYFRELDDLTLHDDSDRTLIPSKSNSNLTDLSSSPSKTGVSNSLLIILLTLPILIGSKRLRRKID